MNLAKNFEEIIHAFAKHDVEFMIVGGYAVIFHGYARTTADLDLFVNPTNSNKEKLIKAFKFMKSNS
jgi:hypothetical protein